MLVRTRHIAAPWMPAEADTQYAPNRTVAGADTQYGPDRFAAGAVVDQADSTIQEYQLYATGNSCIQSRLTNVSIGSRL